MLKRGNKRGQLTALIIVAVLIVAGILVFFAVRGNLDIDSIPAEFVPVYDYYSSCIENDARAAIEIAGSHAGYIDSIEYEPGSAYAPFSNQLNFLGEAVPYWYYISANGIAKEQVPSKSDIENEISDYIEQNIRNCDLEQFYAQGYSIELPESTNAVVKIEDNKVNVKFTGEVSSSKGENSAKKSDYSIDVQSKFGKFYGIAMDIYNKEKSNSFLENYTMDTILLNAPVDGVEISCAPKIWKTQEVANDLQNALESNIGALKFNGDYYELNDKESKYFVIDQDVDESVNLIYSKEWPTKLEINGDGVDDSLMVAKVVGNQPGLGAMGFCYAPYHYVYDLSYPVMVQIYDDNEMFQFPVAVIIDKNQPRKGIVSEIDETESFDVCAYRTQDIQVNVYDVNLNNVDADIVFQCFDQQCNLGRTNEGTFSGKAPACFNGYLIAESEGYVQKKELFSSNNETSADLILDKEYDVDIELRVGGSKFNAGNAIIMFNGANSASASLPDSSKVKLSEGSYNITVYVYGNSSLTLPESKKTQCVDAPQSGVFGFLGATKEKCYDIVIPETKIEYTLIGGGMTQAYLLPDDLQKGKVEISVESLPMPHSIEEMETNFQLFSTRGADIEFKS